MLDIFLFIHLFGFALLLGDLLRQLFSSKKYLTKPMLYGAGIQFMSGVPLYLLSEKINKEISIANAVILIFIITLILSHKKSAISKSFYYLILILVLVGLTVAVNLE